MKLFQFLEKALSEGTKPSAMRVFNFWVVLLFVTVVAFGFIWVVVNYSDLVNGYLAIMAGIILGALGLKGWQKKNEKPN